MMKRVFSILLMLSLVFGMTGFSHAENPYAVTEPITIEFWHALSNDTVLNALIDAFEEENPLITVVPICQGDWADINTKLAAAIAAGTSDIPAVVTLNPAYVGTYAESGMLEPIDDFIDKTDFPIEDFSVGMVNTFVYGDSTVGLPYLNSGLVMFYNKDIVDAEVLTLPDTWGEMDGFMQAATTDDHKAMGIHAGGIWYTLCLFTNRGVEYGDESISDTGIDSDIAIETASALKQWYDDGKMDYFYGSSASADGRTAFTTGELVMYVQSTAAYQSLVGLSDFEIGIHFPPGGELGRYSHVGGQGISIPAAASQEQKNAGWMLIEYLTSPEANLALAEATGYLPTRTTTIDSEVGMVYLNKYPAFIPVVEMLDNIVHQPRFNNSVSCNNLWLSMMSEAIIEDGDMQAAMKEIAHQVTEIMLDN